jgi:hypothetical protein
MAVCVLQIYAVRNGPEIALLIVETVAVEMINLGIAGGGFHDKAMHRQLSAVNPRPRVEKVAPSFVAVPFVQQNEIVIFVIYDRDPIGIFASESDFPHLFLRSIIRAGRQNTRWHLRLAARSKAAR